MIGFDSKDGSEPGDRGQRRPGRPALWATYRFWAIATTLATALVWSSCGQDEFNVFRPEVESMALKGSASARLEQARIDLDQKKFDAALAILTPMIGGVDDSNQARLYYAAAKLGQAELDLWSVVEKILGDSTGTKAKSGQSTGNGIDDLLNNVSDSVLGVGAARAVKVAALADAVATLNNAPDATARDVRNTGCLFAAFLAVPTIADAQSGLAATLTALNQIKSSATGGGTECPDIGALDTASASLTAASGNFSLVLAAAKNCPFINVDQAAALMNSVEATLATLTKNADLGCDALPACPASVPNCQALFPSCVQDALKVGSSGAVAGDGKIAACELVLHCTDPTACLGAN